MMVVGTPSNVIVHHEAVKKIKIKTAIHLMEIMKAEQVKRVSDQFLRNKVENRQYYFERGTQEFKLLSLFNDISM